MRKVIAFCCSKCKKWFGEEEPLTQRGREQLCVKCASVQEGPAVHMFKERMFEHLGDFPVMVSSKRQLREECKRRGLRAAYLE